MACGSCTGFSWQADFGEAPVTALSLRRTGMIKPRTTEQNKSPSAMQPQQMSMAFESKLLGLTVAERMKALMHLAHLLMLAAGVAAGVAAEENDDER
jgi:catabolite regulation protein CreA